MIKYDKQQSFHKYINDACMYKVQMYKRIPLLTEWLSFVLYTFSLKYIFCYQYYTCFAKMRAVWVKVALGLSDNLRESSAVRSELLFKWSSKSNRTWTSTENTATAIWVSLSPISKMSIIDFKKWTALLNITWLLKDPSINTMISEGPGRQSEIQIHK